MRRTALAAFALTAAACSNAPAQPVPDNPEEAASVVAAARSCDLTQFEDTYSGAPEAEFNGDVSAADRNQLNSELWLEVIDERPCVYSLPSGLRLRVLRAAGEEAGSPEPGELVRVHYEGLFPSGDGFDSSYERGQPADFPSDRLIAGWVEALGHMRAGEEWELFIPADLAYGERGAGGVIGPNQALYFRMELLCLPSREDANCPEG